MMAMPLVPPGMVPQQFPGQPLMLAQYPPGAPGGAMVMVNGPGGPAMLVPAGMQVREGSKMWAGKGQGRAGQQGRQR